MLTTTLIKYISFFRHEKSDKEIRIFLESAPQYPTLLSVMQTLRYAGIDAQIGKCDWEYLSNLSTPFLIHLKNGEKENLVIARWDKIRNCIKTYSQKNKLWSIKNQKDVMNYWDGVVIYDDNDNLAKQFTGYNTWVTILIFLIGSFIISHLYFSGSNIFYYIPVISGCIVSGCLYLKSEMANNYIIDRLCHIWKSTDCERVNKSVYSSLFGFKMNCLALSFFISQLAIIVIGSLLEIDNVLNSLYFISTVIALPTIAYSAYSQFKIRTGCPLCAMVILCIVTETVIFINWSQRPINPSVPPLYCCIFLPAILISRYISNIKQRNDEHISTMIDLLKLKRKKEVMLSESTPSNCLYSPLWFGEQTSPVNVTTIISPKCSHCRKTVAEFVALKQKGLKFRWNIILGQSTRKDADIIDSWVHQFMTDKKKFFDNLILWSNGTDQISPSLSKNSTEGIGLSKIRQSFDKQIAELKISGFPRILLNDRLLSPIYTATDLEFLIEDKNI